MSPNTTNFQGIKSDIAHDKKRQLFGCIENKEELRYLNKQQWIHLLFWNSLVIRFITPVNSLKCSLLKRITNLGESKEYINKNSVNCLQTITNIKGETHRVLLTLKPLES